MLQSVLKTEGIYLGNRGANFKDLILKILKRGRLRTKVYKSTYR